MAYINLQKMALEAFEHIEKKEWNQAESKLSYLLNANPNDPILYYYLGCLFLDRKQYAFAIIAYEKALNLDPTFDECLNNLASPYRQLGQIDKCIDAFQKAVDIAKASNYLEKCGNDISKYNRNLSDYLGNLGSCYIASGCPKKAISILDEAIKFDATRLNGLWNRGLAYLEMGNYEQGFKEYDCGDRVGPEKERSYHGGPMSTPVWKGPHLITETNPKKTIVVYGEQGIGDEIMFASILPDVIKDADIILECHPRLMELFRLNFPQIPIFGTRKSQIVNWAKNYKIDEKIAIGSLAKHYRKKKEDFPGTSYLKANPNLIELMRKKLNLL